MSTPIHRQGDKRTCGATTRVKGQSTVYVNGKLASVQGDPNTHKQGELLATVNDGTVYINNKKVVLKGSLAAADKKKGKKHSPPKHKAVDASPNVFACGGGGVGGTPPAAGPDPTREELYGTAPAISSSGGGSGATAGDPAVQRNADGSPQPGDSNYTPPVASPESQNPSQDVVEVLESGAGYNVVRLRDGTVERRDGTFAWRNNNPGNIEDGAFARANGAIPAAGSRFAVFPNYETGRAAKEKLLWETESYQGRTIDSALNRYAPPFENNTNRYVNTVSNAVGVSPNTQMSSLTVEQRSKFLDAMERVEGYKIGDAKTLGSG